MTAVIIENRILTVKPGTVVEHIASGRIEKLAEGWGLSDFGWPDPVFPDRCHAVNVHITGRTFRQPATGLPRVKAKLEFIHEDEPSTFADALLVADPTDFPCAY